MFATLAATTFAATLATRSSIPTVETHASIPTVEIAPNVRLEGECFFGICVCC